MATSNTIVSQLDLAWAGGFIDGEACIHLARVKRNCGNRVNYRLRVAVSQNCEDTLLELQRILRGGFMTRVRRTMQHTRQVHTLVLDGRTAIAAIIAVEPYLRRKRPEAQVAIRFYQEGMPSLHPGPNGTPTHIWALREWCYDSLRTLKRGQP